VKSKLFPAIPVLVSLFLVACAPQIPAPATVVARTGGVLRVGQAAGDVGTVDPHYASGTQDRALVDMVYNGLLRFTPGDTTSFQPDLATALPQAGTDAAGKQVWTFSLRTGVQCHPSDGVPAYELTGDDVVYSLKMASNKETSAYSTDYAGMTFASPDPYTVKVTLDKPLSPALFYPRVANYSGGYILSDDPNLKRDLAKRYKMIVFPETKAAFVVNLKGTYKAMAAGRKCLKH